MLLDVRAAAIALAVLLLAGCDAASSRAEPATPASAQSPARVAALGRLQPLGGVIVVSAASVPDAISGAILDELHVDVGDDVVSGQLLAITDTAKVLNARVAERQTEATLAERRLVATSSAADAACVRAGVLQRDADRLSALLQKNLAAVEETDRASGAAQAGVADCTAARSEVEVAEAGIAVAKAKLALQRTELDRSKIYAPVDGRILAINTRPGEQIGLEGVLEIGAIKRMVAVAEVYETDVRRLQHGQRATVSSPALPNPLEGRVELIHPLVRKQDTIGTDPAARKDARIVEVEVLLDEPASAAGLTNLQVDVVFYP